MPRKRKKLTESEAILIGSDEYADCIDKDKALTLYNKRIAKLINNSKDRTYLTFEQLDRALPKKRASGEYIERVIRTITQFGISLISTEEADVVKKEKSTDFIGKINVDIKEDSDYIYLKIEDNGVGFEKIDKLKMVNPYFTTKEKGTGLGLAIVTKIINDHNSLITFNSTKNGAKVKITLPKKYE